MQNHPNHRYLRLFTHFGMRLGERYNVFITFEDYVELCKVDIKDKQPDLFKKDATHGNIMIDGVMVRVVKVRMSNNFRPLITALPKNYHR